MVGLNNSPDAPMQQSRSSSPACVLERFPEKAGLIRELVLSNMEFRSICEDYAEALNTLVHFRARPDADERPEVAEYEVLIRELEAELAAALEAMQEQRDTGEAISQLSAVRRGSAQDPE